MGGDDHLKTLWCEGGLTVVRSSPLPLFIQAITLQSPLFAGNVNSNNGNNGNNHHNHVSIHDHHRLSHNNHLEHLNDDGDDGSKSLLGNNDMKLPFSHSNNCKVLLSKCKAMYNESISNNRRSKDSNIDKLDILSTMF